MTTPAVPEFLLISTPGEQAFARNHSVQDIAQEYIENIGRALGYNLHALTARASYLGPAAWSVSYVVRLKDHKPPLSFRAYSATVGKLEAYVATLDTLHHLKFVETVYPSANALPVCFYSVTLCLKKRDVDGDMIDLNIKLELTHNANGH